MVTPKPVLPDTLPAWLAEQARHRPHAPALRHKRLGQWEQLSWHALATKVEALAAGLAAHDFGVGDALLLVSQPREEALLLSLAAQWRGGVAVPLEPSVSDQTLGRIVRHLTPLFTFADDDRQIDRLLALSQWVIDANPRGLRPHPHADVVEYAALASPSPSPDKGVKATARPDHDAFIFYRDDAGHGIEEQRITHATLIREALLVAGEEHLKPADDAFAARAFATTAQARYLVAPWLLTGFRLNFPESLETRDNDRRELSPTLVAGTRETYGRVARLVDTRLPGANSIRRRLLDRLSDERSSRLLRLVAWWGVARPLREVIGFKRTHAALIAGAGLDDDAARLFKALRIDVRMWPDDGQWQRLAERVPSAHEAADVHGQPA
ncbi:MULTISPECIES: AMP-binding protein [unclassified Caballeronia]|uniref:AMP-binding protein n=1 Tax=unclassified Caballeronia TaxID=2646786 RepID=UPI0013EC6392|nr:MULTISPECIES: AMP-binding protein [unclassified Caballeronia]